MSGITQLYYLPTKACARLNTIYYPNPYHFCVQIWSLFMLINISMVHYQNAHILMKFPLYSFLPFCPFETVKLMLCVMCSTGWKSGTLFYFTNVILLYNTCGFILLVIKTSYFPPKSIFKGIQKLFIITKLLMFSKCTLM